MAIHGHGREASILVHEELCGEGHPCHRASGQAAGIPNMSLYRHIPLPLSGSLQTRGPATRAIRTSPAIMEGFGRVLVGAPSPGLLGFS
jgi:hypothetical protein